MVDGDAAAFLPPVLQGLQAEIGVQCHIPQGAAADAEYAALLMYAHKCPLPKDALG